MTCSEASFQVAAVSSCGFELRLRRLQKRCRSNDAARLDDAPLDDSMMRLEKGDAARLE
jgi:hypothetical protein